MKPIGIELIRYPYEEPYHLNLAFSATNGLFSGYLEYYCNADDLAEIGQALHTFPKKVPDEYVYEIGSTRPEDNFAYFFSLRAYTVDMSGHCALQIIIDNRFEPPADGSCCFSIKTDPSAINRLGKLLLTFADLKHNVLKWSVAGDGDALLTEEFTFI